MALKRYHFDLGDSSDGPVGYCAAVWAENEPDALRMLHEMLPMEADVLGGSQGDECQPGVEYITVYFNDEALTADAIDDVEEPEDVKYL